MIAPARAAAFRALQWVSAEQADLGDAVARTRDGLADVRNRAMVTDLVSGTLRWRGAIDYQLARLSGREISGLDSDVLDALRLGAYQLLYLERVPASAVVNDSVAMTKRAGFTSAAGFVNAVLRRLSRERDTLVWPRRPPVIEDDRDLHEIVTHLAVVQSHPRWLVQRWVARYGAERTEQWLRFNNGVPALTLAANRLVCTRDQLASRLASEGIRTTPTRVAPFGLTILEGRPLSSEAFRAGACLVQDEASQLISEVVAARASERVLDACAAPGGKTVALAAQVTAQGRVIATDVRPRRVRVLADTVARCGASNVRIVQTSEHDPLPFREASFDRVLVDAPCSGLGTVRRDPDIRWRREPDDLAHFAGLQSALLSRVAPAVRPGGRLVYSTCSSEPEENEAVIARFLYSAPDFEPRPLPDLTEVPAPVRAVASADGFLRTDPSRDGLEAFFAAVLQRRCRDV